MAKTFPKPVRLQNEFDRKKIPTNQPGFFDHPNFVAEEKMDPAYLDQYARYVLWKKYDDEYLIRARKIIETVAKKLHEGLVRENRLGACIDTSMTMGRILDLHGIWNFVVRGALRISFPTNSGFNDFCFYPVDIEDGSNRQYGHKWVFAPPFDVIDVTVKLQEYDEPFVPLLPELVLLESAAKVRGNAEDIICPLAIKQAAINGMNPQKALARFLPKYVKDFASDFSAFEAEVGSLKLKYVPIGVGGSDVPLEKINSFVVEGRNAYQFYVDEIRPLIEAM